MELNYSELAKREVVNVVDGRSLGRIIDMKFKFPEGKIIGIIVPGRRTRGLLRIFDKSQLYIEERRIVKIGGDVILVDLRCAEVCSPSVALDRPPNDKPCAPSDRPCPPSANHCPPPHGKGGGDYKPHDDSFRFDLGDY